MKQIESGWVTRYWPWSMKQRWFPTPESFALLGSGLVALTFLQGRRRSEPVRCKSRSSKGILMTNRKNEVGILTEISMSSMWWSTWMTSMQATWLQVKRVRCRCPYKCRSDTRGEIHLQTDQGFTCDSDANQRGQPWQTLGAERRLGRVQRYQGYWAGYHQVEIGRWGCPTALK